ncbi:glycosyl hydrolase 108 family protein [Arthrospira platensis SPKY2]
MSQEVNFNQLNIFTTCILILIFINSDKVKENILFRQINENQNLEVVRTVGNIINREDNKDNDIVLEPYIREILKQAGIEDRRFGLALQILFPIEGGYTNDPHDAGGRTKYGIAENFDGRRHNLDIKNITRVDAAKIYYTDYWIESRANKEELYLAIAIFNAYVHAGRIFSINKTADDYQNAMIYLDRTNLYYDRLDPRKFERYMRGYKRRTQFTRDYIKYHKDPDNNVKPIW